VQHRYYTLVASLPRLPRIEEAERLPINRERLDQRLRMLRPEDAAVIARAEGFLTWRSQPGGQTDADIVRATKEILDSPRLHPAVRDLVEFRMELRTIVAALRRRRRGESAPTGNDWGISRWMEHIRRNWQHPDFKLSNVFPWVPEAREQLEKGESVGLERLLMQVMWNFLDGLAFGHEFDVVNVLTYVMKWDILKRWLSQDPADARARFDELVAEAMAGRMGGNAAKEPKAGAIAE